MMNLLATVRHPGIRFCIALILISGSNMIANPTSAKTSKLSSGHLASYFACLRANGATIVSAHRGAPSPGTAENSVPAFVGLANKRLILAETDIHTSRDGILMINHDDKLDRTTTLRGPVWEHDWAAIRTSQMRDASGAITPVHPPSFAELLYATDKGPVIQLDIKKAGIEDLLTAVEAAHAQSRVIYLAYTDADIAAIVRRQPDAIVSTVIPTAVVLQRVLALGVRPDHLQAMFFERDVDRAFFAALREEGVTVLVAAITAEEQRGGPNRPLTAARYAEIGESGAQILVSNFPELVRAALPKTAEETCGSPMGS